MVTIQQISDVEMVRKPSGMCNSGGRRGGADTTVPKDIQDLQLVGASAHSVIEC
jgi:hypothetical protein